MRPGQIVLDDSTPEELNKKVGDIVEIQFSKGNTRTVTVVGVFTDEMGMMTPGTLVPSEDGQQFQTRTRTPRSSRWSTART